jgi:hypothetical protein
MLSEREKEILQLSEVDLVVRFGKQWSEDMEIIRASVLEHKVTMSTISIQMRVASELLRRNYPQLEEGVDNRLLRAMAERHQALCGGLVDVPAIAKRMTVIFPKAGARSIMEWYTRFIAGLKQLERLQGEVDRAKEALSQFLGEYPGPELPMEWRELYQGPLTLGMSAGGHPIIPKGSVSPLTEKALGQQEGQSAEGGPTWKNAQGSGAVPDEGWIRREAASAGRGFRTGVGPASVEPRGGEEFWETPHTNGPQVYDLPATSVRSRGQGQVKEEGSQAGADASVRKTSRGGGSRAGDSWEEVYEGFEDMTLEEIHEEIAVYVSEKLTLRGRGTAMTEAILLDNLPPIGVVSKASQRSAQIRDMVRQVKEIKPQSNGTTFISLCDWWKAINDQANSFCWSIELRILFLKNTGGLAAGIHDENRDRVKEMMTDISSWLTDYDVGHRETDARYWIYIWMDVGIQMIEEFHQVLPTHLILEGLVDLMGQKAYKLTASSDDPLNQEIWKVHALYRAGNNHLRRRSADLVNTPIWWWQIMIKGLMEQPPGGPMMIVQIDKALAKLPTNPGSVLAVNHGLSCGELDEVRRQGTAGATERTYELVLKGLKDRALRKELTIEFRSLADYQNVGKKDGQSGGAARGSGWQTQGRGGRSRSVNSVNSDYSPSTLTGNTFSSAGGTRPRGACPICQLFHNTPNGKCEFVKEGKLQLKSFLNHYNVRSLDIHGKSTLSEYWVKKLEKFVFPALKITDKSRQKKIVDELRKLARDWPTATQAEVERFAANSKRFLAQAVTQDSFGISILRKEVNLIVNAVAARQRESNSGSSEGHSGRRSSSRRQEEEDSDSDEDVDSEDDYSLN